MPETKKTSYLKSAAILAAATIFVKIIGAVYKVPILTILGNEGTGYFQTTYGIYTMILTIATAGIPAALSRLVSSAATKGKTALVKRYFSVALPAFIIIGTIAMVVMYAFADQFAAMMNNPPAADGIRVLAPAVLFVCIISVYRGYMQGFENMVPTAVSQAVEVLCKAAFGISAAMWLVSMNYEKYIVSAGSIMGVTVGLGLCVPLLVWYKKRYDRKQAVAGSSGGDDGAADELPGRMRVFGRLMEVSIPITLGASFMAIMTVIDNSVVLGRLQNALHYTVQESSALSGILTKGLTVYNFPPALIVPVAVSIIPAIAAALAINRDNDAANIMQSSVKLTNLLAMPAGAGIAVLAGPILKVLYYDPAETPETAALMAAMLSILGLASFFVCLQHVTTAILQASGHERIALMTFPVGAVIKIIITYTLAGNPDVGIVASPIGTLVCFMVISALNIFFILIKVNKKLKFGVAFLKPFFCTAIMSVVAFLTYKLVFLLGAGALGVGRLAQVVYLAASIFVAVIVYGILIIVMRAITMEDMVLVPKGEKVAKILKIR